MTAIRSIRAIPLALLGSDGNLARHGTAARYCKGPCHCRRCTSAYAAYRRGAVAFSERENVATIHARPTDRWPGKA